MHLSSTVFHSHHTPLSPADLQAYAIYDYPAMVVDMVEFACVLMEKLSGL